MLDTILVRDIMARASVCLPSDVSLGEALETLEQAQQECAPVVNSDGELLGIFSLQNWLVELWCQDYTPLANDLKVTELMSSDFESTKPGDSVLQLAEFMSIAHEQVYPVTSDGMLTATAAALLPLRERARRSATSRPAKVMVVEHGKLMGEITRQQVVALLRDKLN
ncbi:MULTISPECIES: CBS domain-containing protein [Aliagarivorans]|uniref:CBS domain-containing protein n=1 Tax=Aliagarivorans TaxID=882379 RepID=UPI000479BAB9|nr:MULTISPECIES: CBS domain-containing protein [Aliagarivorans]